MNASILISEIQKARALIISRLSGVTPTMPLGIALVDRGIAVLAQLQVPESTVRSMCERAIALYSDAKVVTPSKDEIVKLLGPTHDERNEE